MCQEHFVMHLEKQHLAHERLLISNVVQSSGHRNAPVAFLWLLWAVLVTKSSFYHSYLPFLVT